MNGSSDGFYARVNADGSNLLYSTFYGGSGTGEAIRTVALNGDGHAYVAGYTTSTDLATASAYDASHNGMYDLFVAEINPAGTGVADLVYGTYLGGSSNDFVYAIDVDESGNVYVTGNSSGDEFGTQRDYATVKYAPDGTELWTTSRWWSRPIGIDVAATTESGGSSVPNNTPHSGTRFSSRTRK